MSDGLLAVILTELHAANESDKRALAEVLRPYLVDEPEHLLDARGMAEVVGVHPDTLVRWARGGRIWGKKVGREWRFRADRSDVLPAAGSSRPDVLTALPKPRPTPRVRPSVAAIRGNGARLS